MKKYATLVFDDGPNDFLTKMVDKIESYGFTAAFAIIGRKVNDETEKSLKYAIDHGFELVAHGQNHVHLGQLSKEEMIYEFTEPIKNVEKRLGYKIKLARLPFIAYNDIVLETATELNLPLLGAGMGGGRDWAEDTTVEIIANATLNNAKDGAVACLHVTEKTLASLDVVLPKLKEDGFVFVTPSELFKIKGIENHPLGININNVNDFI